MITVGKVGRPRGVHGEMYVTPLTDFPERFVGLKEIFLDARGNWEKRTIISSRLINGRPVIGLAQVTTPEEASRLTNRSLAVPRDQLVELPEDTYFIFDLVGAEVVDDATGAAIGKLTDVQAYPANDVYVIRQSDGREVLCPAIRDFVKKVDTAARQIRIVAAGLTRAE